MKALLIIAHGSRREDSNQEVRRLTAQLRQRAGQDYAEVHCAFLELAEPSIPEGIAQCIAQGAEEVVLLPYFLSAGRHVAKDIPAEMAKAQADHPAIRLRLAPYLGLAEGLIDALLRLAK
ncbi:MAG: CbiX/SirB N-terminal domain-containing protein [Gammaproteobacteria bacterium]|nr:CbiX/SirB N-terminal domain-containing protein [Gammaproteobacteria bacterium]